MKKLTKAQQRELKRAVRSGQLDGGYTAYPIGKKLIERGYLAWEQVITTTREGRMTTWSWRLIATAKGRKVLGVQP